MLGAIQHAPQPALQFIKEVDFTAAFTYR